MKVGIDISNLHSLSKARGIGYYTDNLVKALKTYTDIEVAVLENKREKKQVDLVHYPFFDLFSPTLKIDKNIPTVVTIHDVIPLKFPKAYPPGLRGTVKNFHQKFALKRVQGVITDSDSSKKDIEKYLKVSSSKVHVVYLAASDNFKKIDDQKILKEITKKYQLPERFVLFTGSTNWNKNLLNLTEGATSSGVDIVFAGKSFETHENLNHIELKPFADFIQKYGNHPLVHILGFVPHEDIVALFNLAGILLLPSFYEGFGLTILEAQKCGVPVITANNSSLNEVGGDSVLYVNPEDPESIKSGILRILTDKKLKLDLINRGFENSQKFSWEKCAKETKKVYQEILNS